MSWTFQPAKPAFDEMYQTWDSVNRAGANHILLDSGFISPLLRHFANGNVIQATRSDSAGRGMALLIRKRLGHWETFQPAQAPIGLFLLERADSDGRDLLEMTRELPGHALQLSILQQDPEYTSGALNQSHNGFERLDYIRTARITLSGTFEEYWQRRGTNLRHNLSRRRRRATEKGLAPKLIARRAPDEVAAAIQEYGRLESSGWKGRDGTAVSSENAQGRFYRDVFECFCARGEGIIYQLVLGDKVAASDLCLVRNGMMVVLKTAYDEASNDFSPAFLMREEILRELYAQQQVRVIEFYGRVMDWHTRWTDEIRTMYHINVFRYGWLQSLKNLRKGSP